MKSSIQFNAALTITAATRGSSRGTFYQELGFESLQQRWWYRKLFLFFKISQSLKKPISQLPH